MSGLPPNWAIKFLRWYCREDFIDEIEGDLFELYYHRVQQSGWKANLFFVWNVIRTFRMSNMKTNKTFTSAGMVKNYFKIGFRSMTKDLKFTMINLTGLSLGLSVFLIILLLVQHELSFDDFHSKKDRIYQVIQVFKNADGDDPEIFTSTKLSEALRNEVPNVETAVTIHGASSSWMEANGKRLFEEDGIVAGPQFFEIFDFELINGNEGQVLASKRSIILSESMAIKFFDSSNPMGKEVSIDSYGRFTVTGVMKDVPTNSYIQFNFIISQDYDVYFQNVASWWPEFFQSWKGSAAATYVLLDDAENSVYFEDQVHEVLEKNLGGADEINRHYLLGLKELHFNSDGIDGRVNQYVKGDYKQVQFLVAIAIIILSMACFNYINISTSRYIKRTKEVGIRKAMGAYNAHVTFQFLVESFIMVFFSFLVGLIFVNILLPYFTLITGIELELNISSLIRMLPYFLLTVLMVTVLAGFYPAFHLSRFPAISVLKNMTVSKKGNGFLRKGLVSVQYTFVIIILASLAIVNQQYSFMNNKSLGFGTDDVLVVEINGGGVRDNYTLLKSELLQLPGVSSVTGLTRMISGYRSGATVSATADQDPENNISMRFYGMDSDGLSTLKMELLHGKDFSGNSSDSTSFILNETAAERYGGAMAIGNLLELEDESGDLLRGEVIGIVKDFHYRSLHESIGPVVIGHYRNPIQGLDDIVIKLNGNFSSTTLEGIEQVHSHFDENDVMTWEFLDDMIQRSYEKELIFRDIFVGASFLSFCIAILGMVGLTSFNIISKTKEIGIRKILGATFVGILGLQIKEFVKILGFSAIITLPVFWILGSQWLEQYEYRVNLSPLVFIAALVFVLAAIFVVVSLVGYKVAKEPPVKAIKYE